MLATRRCNLPSTAALIPRGRTLPARTSNSTKQDRINVQHLTVTSLLQVSHLETAHTITLRDFSIGLVFLVSCSFIPDQMWFLMLFIFLNLEGQTNYFSAVPNDTTMGGYLTRRCNLPSIAALIPRGRTLPARTSNSTKQDRINVQHLTVTSLLQVSHLETAHTITLRDFSIGLVFLVSCSFIPDQMWFLMLFIFLNLEGQTNYFSAVPNDTTMGGYLTRRCNLPSIAALIPRGRTLPARTSNSTKQDRINVQHLTVTSLLQVSHLETAHTITLRDFSIGLVFLVSCSFIPDQMWFLMLFIFLNLEGQTNYFSAVPNDTTMGGYLTRRCNLPSIAALIPRGRTLPARTSNSTKQDRINVQHLTVTSLLQVSHLETAHTITLRDFSIGLVFLVSCSFIPDQMWFLMLFSFLNLEGQTNYFSAVPNDTTMGGYLTLNNKKTALSFLMITRRNAKKKKLTESP